MHYVGFIFGDESGGYGVTVPDIPGFTAHVENGGISAAVETAQRVLTDHVAAMADAGLEIPAARSPDELEKLADVKAEWDEADAFVMLRVVYPAGRTLRINVTMDENVLDVVDAAARERGLTRSAFIAEASRRLAVGEPSGGAARTRKRG
ncbi:MAG: hypothetical protein QOG13_2358 [Sphingomonadales bacterium]|jgi:predicted RNase H-like HicB family nuclease|nr:hypothetical protein [Sphingomonadales bacterium]